MLNGKLTFSLIDRVQEMTLLHTLAIQLDISEACSCSFLTNLYAMDLGVMLLLLYTFSILGFLIIKGKKIINKNKKKIKLTQGMDGGY